MGGNGIKWDGVVSRHCSFCTLRFIFAHHRVLQSRISSENTMPPLRSLLFIALSGAFVKGTNTSGDPTDLANWPPCAVSFVSPLQRTYRVLSYLLSPTSKHASPSDSHHQPHALVFPTSPASVRIRHSPYRSLAAKRWNVARKSSSVCAAH